MNLRKEKSGAEQIQKDQVGQKSKNYYFYMQLASY